MILDNFKDILKHTHNLGFDMVKVLGSTTETKIESMIDTDIIMYGSLHNNITGLSETVGLTRLNLLKGYIDNPGYAGAVIKILTQTNKDNVESPSGLKFEGMTGTNSEYRFMSQKMIDENLRVPPFRGANWNVVITPNFTKLAELYHLSSTHGSYEKSFTVSVSKNTLYFNIGGGVADNSKIVVAENVNGMLASRQYPLSHILGVLKIGQSSKSCVMSFSDQGAVKIDIDSGLGKYQYVIPETH